MAVNVVGDRAERSGETVEFVTGWRGKLMRDLGDVALQSTFRVGL